MVTHHEARVVRVPYGIDRLGYCYCANCLDLGCGQGTEVQQAEPSEVVRGGLDRLGPCDGCHRTPSQFPSRSVAATVTVEHTPARIF